jgi:serine protease Do
MSTRLQTAAIAAAVAVIAYTPPAHASETIDPLAQFSASIEALVQRVSPSVVQVLVTGYGPLDEHHETDADLVVGKQRTEGSGVIVASDGYIVTNAHVVDGGRHIEVVLPEVRATRGSPLRSLVKTRGQIAEARVVGVARDVDLALLKIDATGLVPLPMANYDALHQGELVFAFGSPEGLRNSVTMGVVSSAARQPDEDHPMVYVQTDAPINHGNSGGPLVNVHGELVGINTFILSESGGSQGLGFAIPSALVEVAVEQLRTYGHLHQGQIGAQLQTVTPDLARGLNLPRSWGVIVSDVVPGGPADRAGLRVGDIVLRVDDRRMDSLPLLAFSLYTRHAGDRLQLRVQRGGEEMTLNVPVTDRPDEIDRLRDRIDPETSLVHQLGILGLEVNGELTPILPRLRLSSGVVVAARTPDPHAADVSLSAGDVIHAVNGRPVATMVQLRDALDRLAAHSSVVLQVERDGSFHFVAFELD